MAVKVRLWVRFEKCRATVGGDGFRVYFYTDEEVFRSRCLFFISAIHESNISLICSYSYVIGKPFSDPAAATRVAATASTRHVKSIE
jgi:hypothetical protein